jgi:hypothetical protein
MKKMVTAMLAGTMWFTASMFGQEPGAGGNSRASCSNCQCDKDVDGKCDTCGRTVAQGRAQGRRQGRGHMMAMRGGNGRGNGPCMRIRNRAPGAPAEQPKVEKK